jgi:hypothetical protein
MKQKLITLSFLLIATWSYCQETYPKKIAFEQDTVICINKEQLVKINGAFEELEHYKGKLDSIGIEIDFQKTMIEKQLSINSKLSSRNVELLIENDNLYQKDEINRQILTFKEKELKYQKKKSMELLVGGFTIGVGIGAITALILTQ